MFESSAEKYSQMIRNKENVFRLKINMFIMETLLGGLDRWIYIWVHREAGTVSKLRPDLTETKYLGGR